MDFDLERPDHLPDEPWNAIKAYRTRFENAWRSNDRPAAIGAAKDLIECVARAVLDAKGVVMAEDAKFPALISSAQKSLERHPGPDVSASQEIKRIASAAMTMVNSVNTIRNDVGTGHGRSRVLLIDDEMFYVASDAAMLWVRWALRRLKHVLAGRVDLLIVELHESSSRDSLRRHFDAVCLPDQPPDEQHRLGVSFGQEAGGGYGNARIVGLSGAAESDDLSAWPAEYRLGLAEGMVIDRQGRIGLVDHFVPLFVGVLLPVPPKRVTATIKAIISEVESARWIKAWRWIQVDPHEVLATLQEEQLRLPAAVQSAMDDLREALARASNL